jgi:hypothetical protein
MNYNNYFSGLSHKRNEQKLFLSPAHFLTFSPIDPTVNPPTSRQSCGGDYSTSSKPRNMVRTRGTGPSRTSTSSYGNPTRKNREKRARPKIDNVFKGGVTKTDLGNKTKSYHHGIAACTCIDKVNTAVPVATRASARSVWERSETTSGARCFSQLVQLYLLFARTVCTWLVYRFQPFFVRARLVPS